MDNIRKWHAVYTKPRWEKKVFALLEEKGIQSYCPLNKIRKRWSDRYKIVNEPLFKSYLFVNIKEDEINTVRMCSGVVNFVYWNHQPAIIREKEINIIRKFLNDYEFVSAEPIQLIANQRIQIMNGVLMDNEAIVIRSERNKVYAVLENLGYKLTVTFKKNEIKVLDT